METVASSFELLKKLDVSCLPLITEVGVASLQRLPNLTKLSIGDCSQVTEGSLAVMRHLIGLAELSLEWSGHLGDAAILQLRQCHTLRKLDVTHCHRISFQATIRALAHIPDLVIVKLA